jgi:hypothetical protein
MPLKTATAPFPVIPWNGKRIVKPGLFSGIPIDAYHQPDLCGSSKAVEPAISSGGLRTIFGKSLKHYWATSPYNPEADVEDEESEALIMGRAAHHLIFGEKRFSESFALAPQRLGGEPWSGRRNACKEWVAARRAEGMTVITQAQADGIKGMAASLLEEPLVKAGILDGLIEHSLIWKDAITGIWLKARPDAVPSSSLDLVDLKTTSSVMQNDLQRTIHDHGYYQQGALIAEACRNVLKKPLNSFTLVFVEKKKPWCVEIVTLKPHEIERGIAANKIALARFAKAMQDGKWFGPNMGRTDAAFIELAPWAGTRLDEQIEAELGTDWRKTLG